MRRTIAVILLALCAACARDGGQLSAVNANSKANGQPTGATGTTPRDKVGQGRSVSTLPPPVAATSRAKYQKTRYPIPLKVTVDKTCARPGERIEVVAVTVKGAQVGFTAYYTANNNYIPDLFYMPKDGNVTGTVTWNLVLRPDTPLGRAQLHVLASKAPRTGAYEGSFTVASSC